MALRGTLTHRKTRRLASALGIDQCRALGILEALWHVCAENQVDGGIGRMSNQDIADEMYYGGEPDCLISALMKSGWLDAVENTVERGRLFVHDWHEHADDSVNSKLIQWTKCYANGEPPRLRKLPKDARDRVSARFTERYGVKIWEKLVSLRKDEDLAHIQSPESRARVQSQSPDIKPVEALAPPPAASLELVPAKKPAVKGTRFTLRPLPPEWAQYAVKNREWSPQQAQEVYDDFSDYWISKAGPGSTHADWFATWRRWVRNQRAPPGTKQADFPDRNRQRRQEVLAGLKWMGGKSDESTGIV